MKMLINFLIFGNKICDIKNYIVIFFKNSYETENSYLLWLIGAINKLIFVIDLKIFLK